MIYFDCLQALSASCNAMEAGGWLHRGVVAWNKGQAARAPHKGYFRHQAEFIPWASKGVLKPATHGGPWPGVIDCPVRQADKHHVTGKPTNLMVKLVDVIAPGGLIVDPFAGSGTTGVACVMTGRQFVGIEASPEYFQVMVNRISSAWLERQREAA